MSAQETARAGLLSQNQETHRVFLSCKTCGHWKKGPLKYSEIIDWLRVHQFAGIDLAPTLQVVRESSCPNPCGAS